jgi:hypothetical protein
MYETNQTVLYQRSVATLHSDVVALPPEKPHMHFIKHWVDTGRAPTSSHGDRAMARGELDIRPWRRSNSARRARPSGRGDTGRARPSGHGDARRPCPSGHGNLAMDLSTACTGSMVAAEAEAAPRVEEAWDGAGAHVRAVRGEGRREEEERRWVRERRGEVKASLPASAQAPQPARSKRDGENWCSLRAWFRVL